MKTFFILFVFVALNYAQDNQAIYLENFETIEFENNDGMKALTFTLNREKGLAKVVIIKQGKDKYVFSTITETGMSEPIIITERSVRGMMPTIIRNYTDEHEITVEEINKIINLIY